MVNEKPRYSYDRLVKVRHLQTLTDAVESRQLIDIPGQRIARTRKRLALRLQYERART